MLILTNQSRLCFGALNFGCGISDWHNMIGVAVRGAAVREQKQKTKYRSFKNFDPNEFNEDVGQVQCQWGPGPSDIKKSSDNVF